jgi:hypothetical protein
MFRLIAKIFYAILLFIETVIAIRFVFTLLQASRASVFVNWTYNVSDFFLSPFAGFGIPSQVYFGGFIFDTAALLGLVLYMVLGFILVEMIRAFSD